MARVLVLGADGMVGHIARIYLSERGHDVVSIARSISPDWERLDLEDESALRSFLAVQHPEYVLNCVGVLIKESTEDPLRAIRLNALMPHVLESVAERYDFKVVQVSSDCVFSGKRGPYCEDDFRDADEIYGRTKALGELQNNRDLTIRTSKIGPELHPDGSGLFNWFMNQKGIIRGFTHVMWGGITTLEMVKIFEYVIEHPIAGLIHLTNNEPISKCELLELFAEIWDKKDVIIEHDETRIANRSLLCTRDDFNYCVPSYRVMLEDMHNFMLKHSALYNRCL
ncbi:MAG: SDR family oxidoreductase [Nitrospirota bacterium]|nr:SDR family oxidoreductase [Nitrospirota bacterium]